MSNEKKKVLVVDDEQMILDMIMDILDVLGYDCVLAHDKKEVLELLSKHEIDLIILDMNLENESGEDVYKEIKNFYGADDINVIVSTGYSKNEQIDRLIEQGVSGYIQKPFRIEDLDELLRKIFD